MFWSCSHLNKFWKIVKNTIEKVIGVEFALNPRLVLLGDESILPSCFEYNIRFVKMALIAAIKCIALKWKSVAPPCFNCG